MMRAISLISTLFLVCASDACCAAPIKVVVSANTSGILPYEPLPIRVEFINDSDEPFNLYPEMFTEDDVGSVEIRRPDRSIRRIGRPRFTDSLVHYATRPSRVIAPRTSYATNVTLCQDWDLNQPVFDRPGEYVVWVRYVDPTTQSDLTSNAIEVTVAKPGPTETKAQKIIEENRIQGALYETGAIWDKHDILEQLRRLASVRESQVYANHARLVLAKWHLRRAEESLMKVDLKGAGDELTTVESHLASINNERFTLFDETKLIRTAVDRVRADLDAKKNATDKRD